MTETTYYFDPKTLAHCRLCHEPMLFIYDSAVRDFCHDCPEEAKIDNAKDILGVK